MNYFYIILCIIILLFLLYISSIYIGSDNPEISFISERTCKKIVKGYDSIKYPKSPRIIDTKNLEFLKNNPNILNNKDFIIINKNKMLEPTLPPGFTPVYEQDDTMTDVMEIDEHYKDNDILKTRKVVIQKRYGKESKGEAICRRVMEDVMGKKFIRCRPDFLKYINNQNLELDIWNDELKIGVEYNGEQHYRRIEKWQSIEQFEDQVKRDVFKYNRMDELGYYLITVPYTVKHSMIRLYIEYYLPENVYKRENKK